jgi:hypothetical protein
MGSMKIIKRFRKGPLVGEKFAEHLMRIIRRSKYKLFPIIIILKTPRTRLIRSFLYGLRRARLKKYYILPRIRFPHYRPYKKKLRRL